MRVALSERIEGGGGEEGDDGGRVFVVEARVVMPRDGDCDEEWWKAVREAVAVAMRTA